MEKTLSEILDNQLKFKEDILGYFLSEYSKTTKKLKNLKTGSEYIESEKESFLKKFKEKKAMKSVKNYFMNGLSDYDKIIGRIKEKNKEKEFIVFWDETEKEAKIIELNKKIKNEKNTTANSTSPC